MDTVGGDLLTNGIYVAGAVTLVGRLPKAPACSACRSRARCRFVQPTRLSAHPAGAADLALAYQRALAIQVGAWAASVIALLILPLYLASPADFSPLHVLSKVSSSSKVSNGVILEGLAVLAAVVVVALVFVATIRRLFAVSAALVCLPGPLAMIETARRYHSVHATDLAFILPALVFFAVYLGTAGKPSRQADGRAGPLGAVPPQPASRRRSDT